VWSHDLGWNAGAMEQLMALKDLEYLGIGYNGFNPYKSLVQGGTLSNTAVEMGPRNPWELWSRGEFTRAQLKERDNMRWMVEAWSKFKDFWYGYGDEG